MVILLLDKMRKRILKIIKSKIKAFKVLDWMLVVFGLTALLVFVFIFFRKSSYITATVSIGEDSVIYGSWYDFGPKTWFANLFYKGQLEKDGLGRVQAQVLDVYSYDISPSHKRLYIDVRLNSVYNRATNSYTYKGVPVLVGSTIKLNLDKIYAEGMVTKVQGFPTNAVEKKIKVEARLGDEETSFLAASATKNYIADAIQIGDTVKDNNGLVLIKVLDKRVAPAEATVTTSDGRIVKTIDPSKKDVFLTLEILSEKQNDKYYFLTNIPILIDQIIPLNTPLISIFPTVTKFLTY